MEGQTSSSPKSDDLARDLNQLLDAFGSAVSLDEIATAYLEAGRDIHAAGDILWSLQGSTSGASSLSSKDESVGRSGSSEFSDYLPDETNPVESNLIPAKQKKCSASMGTVSGVIGRDYVRPKSLKNESFEGTKPLKLDMEQFPAFETSEVESETMHKDMEEFLFKMLGDGFQLDMKIIQDVLGCCGYDVVMSVDKLLNLSASNPDKSGETFDVTSEKPCSDACTETAVRSSKSNKSRYDQQKDLLEALFTVPGRIEESPKRTGFAKPYRKPRAFGQVVTGPYRDIPIGSKTTVATLLGPEEDEEVEHSYEALRKAVKEYWITMKEYYKAAIDAFSKGDQERANRCLEEGHFFKRKARESDEKSAQKLLATRDEGMSLDLHEYSPKEAIRLLRLHLTSLSGIQDFRFLKITVGGEIEDSKDVARKRLVLKFLGKESIQWTEEKNGRTIVIRLDEIDPKGLSFAKK